MKTSSFLTLLIALTFSGCATTGFKAPSVEQSLAIERALVSTTATLALAKNPAQLPAARAIVVGIDLAIAENITLTPEQIGRFVKSIGAKHGLTPIEAALFTNLAVTVYQNVVATTGNPIVKAADPTTLRYVRAFKDGLSDAISAVVETMPAA